MQFAVPQFTEVEDRLIARLTLKQFFVLLGAGGLILFFWSIFGPSFIFFVFAVPIGIAGVGAALGKYNGRPMFTYAMPLAAFMTSNRVRIFKREPVDTAISKFGSDKSAKEIVSKIDESHEPTESRLRKLAYLLDSKTQEQGKIISDDRDNIIVAPKPAPQHKVPKLSTVNTLNRPAPALADRHNVVPPKQAPKAAPLPKKFDPNKIFNPHG